MNSQKELISAINDITKKRNSTFDTPAVVLRVEGETVWVHIDGGADETPVLKTINCSEGETVQVRISNGNAFLVGNASAPPTDDKTANVAHFVAEQADEKATEAIRSVGAIEQTVEGKVDKGDSNIEVLSSTMYQNENGVNIYNNTLAVGDSYAHIDGDSFDIKVCTTAGQIDDENDTVMARFGRDESFLQSQDSESEIKLTLSAAEMAVVKKIQEGLNIDWNGWRINNDRIETTGYLDSYRIILDKNTPRVYLGPANTSQQYSEIDIRNIFIRMDKHGIREDTIEIQPNHISLRTLNQDLSFQHLISIVDGNIILTGDVYAWKQSGDFLVREYKKTPTVLTSSEISASTTSYTFTDSVITEDSVIDIYDTIFGFVPTNCTPSAGSCTVTFPAQSASHKIKLFVY